MILYYKDIYDDPSFKDSLREVQTMLTWCRPRIMISPSIGRAFDGSLFNCISKCSRIFSQLNLPRELIPSLKLVFMKMHSYKSSLLDIVPNVQKSITLLSQVKDKVDLETSSRWFREQGDQKKKVILLKVGIKEFHKAEGTVDSVLLANYIKIQIRTIQHGLIPDPIQSLLNWLLADEAIDSLQIEAVSILLSISKDRFDILSALSKICVKILTQGTKAPITPSALASIVPASDESIQLGSNQSFIRENMQKWHKTFGLILANPQVFHIL